MKFGSLLEMEAFFLGGYCSMNMETVGYSETNFLINNNVIDEAISPWDRLDILAKKFLNEDEEFTALRNAELDFSIWSYSWNQNVNYALCLRFSNRNNAKVAIKLLAPEMMKRRSFIRENFFINKRPLSAKPRKLAKWW